MNKEVKQVLEISISSFSNNLENNTQGNSQKGILLVVSYNSYLSHLGQTIHRCLFLLYQDDEIKQVFTPAHFVSFRSARTLSNHLLRTKMYAPERKQENWINIMFKQSLSNLQECFVNKYLWTKKVYKIN